MSDISNKKFLIVITIIIVGIIGAGLYLNSEIQKINADIAFVAPADSPQSSASNEWKIVSAQGNPPLTLSFNSGKLSGSISDATTIDKGVASFDSSDFNVTAGAVSIDYSNGQKASAYSKGFLTATDWTNFNSKISRGDLSVASHAALTLGTANGLSLNDQAISLNLASAATSGALSSTDWTDFNSKEGVLTFFTGLSRAANTITSNTATGVTGGQTIYGGIGAAEALTIDSTTDATKGNIVLNPTGGNVGIGTTTPATILDVNGSLTVHSNIYNTDYITKTPEKNNWINTLPLASTWTDAGYGEISTNINRQPQIIKEGGVYYIFGEYMSGDGSPGHSWLIGVHQSSSLAGPWTFTSDIIPLSTHAGDPDYAYDADPSVLYVPWAEHKWQMWFDMVGAPIIANYGNSTIGHAYADNPLGPWTKQQTAGVTDIVIGPSPTKFLGFGGQGAHAPECFMNAGSVNCLYAAVGTGHTTLDTMLAVANDSQGLGTSFEQWGPVTIGNTLASGDAYRLQSPFAYQSILYSVIENVTYDKYYWVSSTDGGKSWMQLGEAAYPFHSFLVEGSKIWGITQSHGALVDFPMKFYYLDLENINGYAPMADDVIGAKTNLPLISNVYSGYYIQGDTGLYRSAANVLETDGKLVIASPNTTGTTTSSSLSLSNNSLTTGTGLYVTSSTLSSGSLINIAVTGTAAAANTQKALNISISGANGTVAQTTYGGYITNTHSGTTSTNYGLYSTASGGTTNVGLYATASGGTNNYAAIFDAGNVGIGTTAPVSLLNVQGTSTAGILTLSNSSTAILTGNEFGNINFYSKDPSGGGGGGIRAGIKAIATEDHAGTAQGTALTFITSSTQSGGLVEAMRINKSGNVGIGTTSPTANLQVAQGTAGVGTVTTNGTTSVIGAGTQFLNTFKVGDTITVSGETRTIATIVSDTSLTTNTWTGSFAGVVYTLVGGTRFSVLGNGNVGIGTTVPGYLTEIKGSNTTVLEALSLNNATPYGVGVGTATARLNFNRGTGANGLMSYIEGGNFVEGDSGSGILAFGTKSATVLYERMRITSTGNVGIGLTVPTATLHLKAGTATLNTAPLKFNSGVLLTTPEAGAVEFLTNTFYMTATNGVAGSTQRQAIPGVTTGTAAPTTTPIRVGDIYVDTTNHKVYMSDGTASSGNWLILN